MKDLQDEIGEWHRRKYPDGRLERIGLKLGEEAGEVCRAIDRILYAKTYAADREWREKLTDEIGDVAIVLLVLCAKGGLDFETVVRQRAAEVLSR